MKFSALFLTVGFFVLSACSTNIADDAAQPKLNNFEVTYYSGGGMLPVTQRIFISDSLCYWEYDRYNRETIVRWNISPDEMSALANVLERHKYNEITTTKKNGVMDRGGEVISVKDESGVVELNNNGRFFIEEEWLDDFNAIGKYIYQLNSSKVNASKMDVQVTVDQSLISSDRIVRCDFNHEKVFDSDSASYSNPFNAKAYVGLNEVTVFTYFRDSLGYYGNEVVDQQQNLFINFIPDSTTAKVVFENNKISAKRD